MTTAETEQTKTPEIADFVKNDAFARYRVLRPEDGKRGG